MNKPNSSPDITLLTERHLSHHIAHNLNNSLGAIGVFAEMIIEDVHDPKLQARLQKICFAADMARGQVNALRYAVPRYNEDCAVADLAVAYDYVKMLLGDTAVRLMPDETIKVPVMLKGPQSFLVYCLHIALSHILGINSDAVTVDVDMDEDAGMATIRMLIAASINDMSGDTAFTDDVLFGAGAKLEKITDPSGRNGFALHWPLAPV